MSIKSFSVHKLDTHTPPVRDRRHSFRAIETRAAKVALKVTHKIPFSRSRAILICTLLVCCTLLGLAGTDLVLPAVPELPSQLGGTAEQAQLVLATFAAGSALGLLLFGELGSRFNQSRVLVGALVGYAGFSYWATAVTNLDTLVLLRFLQGVCASCAAVFAPGMIRAMFSEQGALRALGVLGSVESLAPALAPILGVWLLSIWGWKGSFQVTALLAFVLSVSVLAVNKSMPSMKSSESAGVTSFSYRRLLVSPMYLRYALGQGFALGGLLVFVFSAPAVIVNSMNGHISDFILMQVCGIATFIFGANMAPKLVQQFGADPTIAAGTLISLLGALGLYCYALIGGNNPDMLWLWFIPLNIGIGFRGPPSFLQALVASNGDDARGSALLILGVLLVTAFGTALAAPWIGQGLWVISLAAVLLLALALAAAFVFRQERAI